MTTKPSNKWFLTRLTLPIATAALMLTSCKDSNSSTENSADSKLIQITIIDDSAHIIDSLLQENSKLTDSLDVVNERLDECNATRNKRCPCNTRQPVKKKPTTPVKPAPAAPTPAKATVAQPASTQVKIDNNNAGNNTVVIGNSNTVNNVVINGCTSVVLDTLAQVKTTRRIMSGHAQIEYTYTK